MPARPQRVRGSDLSMTGVSASRLWSRHPMVGALVLLVFVVTLSLASLAIGQKHIDLTTIWTALINPDLTIYDHLIVRESRVPRLGFALAVGSALGAAGALMQATTRNALADPGLLGVNAGALLAVTIGMVVGGTIGGAWTLALAFGGALLASSLVYTLARRTSSRNAEISLVLAGAGVSACIGGVVTAVSLVDRDRFALLFHWGIASIARQPVADLRVGGVVVIVALIGALALGRSLDILALGDDVAASLGARAGMVRGASVVAISLLAGAATAMIGPLGFVGLMAPHAARYLGAHRTAQRVAFAALAGAALVVLADSVGRATSGSEIPVGLIVPVVGAPALLFLAKYAKPLQ